MTYEMEELLPIVAKLAEKYTGHESTSITYEKAEQFMEAVLYCIGEMSVSEGSSMIQIEKMSAQQAYEIGYKSVVRKVKSALDIYNDVLKGFTDYGNHCLYDAVVKGIPEFFKWYNVEFEPQNTILTLDYPVLKDLSPYSGIDKVYEFIICVRTEKIFFEPIFGRLCDRHTPQLSLSISGYGRKYLRNCVHGYYISCFGREIISRTKL